jgi:hypothetical protein
MERPRLFVLSHNGHAAELPSSAEHDVVALRATLAESEKVMADLRAKLDAMEHTMSWRITSPLRHVRRFAARFFGRSSQTHC